MIRAFLPVCTLSLLAACGPEMSSDTSSSTPKAASPSNMPGICRREAAEKFDRKPHEITTLPAEHNRGIYTVYGSFNSNKDHLITCTFNNNGRLQSVNRA